MTPKQERALAALVLCPTAREAAKAAGLSEAMRNRIDVYNKCDDSEYRQKKDEVIEKMLKLIENSGMNFYDAQNLPMELDSAISASVIAAQGNTAFRPHNAFKSRLN